MIAQPLLPAVGLVALMAACQHTSAPAEDVDSVIFVSLHPTHDGEKFPGSTVSGPIALDRSRAGVDWSSYWWRGGAVAFFEDRTVCTRRSTVGGQRINGERYDASSEIGADMIRLDYTSAEVAALESGYELSRTAPWLLVHAGDTDGASRTIADHAARQLVAAGVASAVFVAPVADVPPSQVRLLLVPLDEPAAISDRLAVSVFGPPSVSTPEGLHVLLEGPETVDQHPASDKLEVRVWLGDDKRVWEPPSENDTERDLRWANAFRDFAAAAERGCTF